MVGMTRSKVIFLMMVDGGFPHSKNLPTFQFGSECYSLSLKFQQGSSCAQNSWVNNGEHTLSAAKVDGTGAMVRTAG